MQAIGSPRQIGNAYNKKVTRIFHFDLLWWFLQNLLTCQSSLISILSFSALSSIFLKSSWLIGMLLGPPVAFVKASWLLETNLWPLYSHKMALPSSPPEAKKVPIEFHLTQLTGYSWLLSSASFLTDFVCSFSNKLSIASTSLLKDSASSDSADCSSWLARVFLAYNNGYIILFFLQF